MFDLNLNILSQTSRDNLVIYEDSPLSSIGNGNACRHINALANSPKGGLLMLGITPRCTFVCEREAELLDWVSQPVWLTKFSGPIDFKWKLARGSGRNAGLIIWVKPSKEKPITIEINGKVLVYVFANGETRLPTAQEMRKLLIPVSQVISEWNNSPPFKVEPKVNSIPHQDTIDSVAVDPVDKALLKSVASDPSKTQSIISKEIRVSISTVQRRCQKLQIDGKLKNVGTKKSPQWQIIL